MSWEKWDYLSDIIVIVENKKYYLHKMYLISIPYFKTIIANNYYKDNIISEDEIVKKEPFESIIGDIYNIILYSLGSKGLYSKVTDIEKNVTGSIDKLMLLRYYNLSYMENELLDVLSNKIMEYRPTYEELDRLFEMGDLLEHNNKICQASNYGHQTISDKYNIIATRFINLVKEILELKASNGTTKYGRIMEYSYGTVYEIYIYKNYYSILWNEQDENYFLGYIYDTSYILSTCPYLSKETWFFDAISSYIPENHNNTSYF